MGDVDGQAGGGGDDHHAEYAAAGQHQQHDVEDGHTQHFAGGLVHGSFTAGLDGRGVAGGHKAGGTGADKQGAHTDYHQEDDAQDFERGTDAHAAVEGVGDGGKDHGADAVESGGHAACHAPLIGEEFNAGADGAAVDKAQAQTQDDAVADHQMRYALGEAAAEHPDAATSGRPGT